MWLLGPAGFPEGSGEKALVVVVAKIEAGCQSNSCPPAPDRRLVGAGCSRKTHSAIGRMDLCLAGLTPGERIRSNALAKDAPRLLRPETRRTPVPLIGTTA